MGANERPAAAAVADQPAADAGRPAQQPGWLSRARPAWIGAYLAAGVVLFLCYLRASGTQSISSDGGSNALEAWDMLHGNLLLHGWTLTDVSFYTTELPEYMLVELVRGLGPAAVHTAAAFTYTLLVLLAGLLAKGRATGREGVLRVLIGSGIMLAPQVGNPVFVLLGVPDHVGTGVPILLTFLVLDRAPRRWYVPPVIALMLAWATIGDRLVIAAAILPLAVVCAIRIWQGVVLAGKPLAALWFEVGLIVAGIVSVGISLLVVRVLGRLGGFALIPLGTHLAKLSGLARHFRLVGEALLGLYGADFSHLPLGPQTAIAAAHLVGLALAAWALGRALRRFFRCDDLLVQVLALGILADLAAFAFSSLPRTIWDTRQISVVLPFGAVLAGRLLAGDLLRAKLVPALAVVLACYTAALGFDAAQPDIPAHDQSLADWLVAHHFTYGLSNYFEGNITTLDSGGRVHLVAVSWGADKSVPRIYQSEVSWYDPTLHYANFVVNTGADQPPAIIPSGDLRQAFGRPAKIYHDGPYTILVWNKNLLADLGRPGKKGPGNVGSAKK
ncbi:MAG TPA: hypothetical protein VJ418_24935 [Streptosporangiaceae bacterium]|jgi:hypothetical protein|nr:hypothetical protein [Streptosporangiaceae bacterium]